MEKLTSWLSQCSLTVLSRFPRCSLKASSLFSQGSLTLLSRFPHGSFKVPSWFSQGSLTVLSRFPRCSLKVPSLSQGSLKLNSLSRLPTCTVTHAAPIHNSDTQHSTTEHYQQFSIPANHTNYLTCTGTVTMTDIRCHLSHPPSSAPFDPTIFSHSSTTCQQSFMTR
jgi:hypothetical protein